MRRTGAPTHPHAQRPPHPSANPPDSPIRDPDAITNLALGNHTTLAESDGRRAVCLATRASAAGRGTARQNP